MQEEVREGEEKDKKVGEGDKNGMSDYILSFPASFNFLPRQSCVAKRKSQKQHLKTKYTYGLIEAVYSIGGSK